MATVPGGVFDSSTNTNVDETQGSLISSFLDSLGLSETSLSQVVVTTTGTNVIADTVSAATFSLDSGQSANVVLSGTSGKTLIVTGSGNASIAGGYGGGADSVLAGAGSDSLDGGGGNDDISGGAGNDVIFDLHELTLPEGEFEVNGTGDSLTGGGPALSNTQGNYLYNVAKNFGASSVMLADIIAALKLLSSNGDTPASELLTFFARMGVSPGSTLTELKLDTGGATEDFLMMTRLKDIPGVTYVFEGMEKLLLVGIGSARVDGSTASMVVADSNAQSITGGSGNDTLVGGGGQDTLTGGAGSDIFGFNALGHYTITDFVQGTDQLAFQVGNVTSNTDLSAFLTEIENADGNTTFHFGPNASITLVGVTTTELLSDMLFTIS